MNKQPPTTKEIIDQLAANRPFTDVRGRLDPYTPEELAQHEQDKVRASAEEAARWAANSLYLAHQKRQVAEHVATVIAITEAPSYIAPVSAQTETARHPQAQ